MLTCAGNEEVEVSVGGPHLVGPLPDIEGVEFLPESSQRIDVLAGHALVKEHPVPDAGVSSRSADEPLEADLPKARVDLGRGASRACEESVASRPDLVESFERRFRDSLAGIAQGSVDVDKDSVGGCGLVLAAGGDLGVSHRNHFIPGRKGPYTCRTRPANDKSCARSVRSCGGGPHWNHRRHPRWSMKGSSRRWNTQH